MEHISSIKQFAIFKKFTKDELQKLIGIGKEKTLAQGEKLFSAGDARNVFFIVLKGKVAILKKLGASEEEVVTLVTAGEYIAEQALYDSKSKHSHSAEARENQSVVLALPIKDIKKLQLNCAFKLLQNLLPLISENFAHASNIILTLEHIGALIGRYARIEEMGTEILKTLLETISASRAIIILKEAGGRTGKVRASIGFANNFMLHKTIFIDDDFIFNQVIQKNELVNIREADYMIGKKKIPYIEKSVLAAPLSIGNHTIGAIALIDKKKDGGFTANNEVLLSIVAQMVSFGINHAKQLEIREGELELKQEFVGI